MPTKKTKKNSFSKAEYERLSAFRYALRQFLSFSEEAAKAAGLTVQQHQALLTIKGFPGRDHITNGELAEWLQIKHHSAVGLVDRLAASGLIGRAHDEVDHRRVYVRLTDQGLAVLEKLVDRGVIKKDDRVVCVSTAAGLKFTEFKVRYHDRTLPGITSAHANPPVDLPADYDQVLKALDAHAKSLASAR